MPKLSDYQLRSLGRITAQKATAYFQDPKNLQRFEDAFYEKNGCSYADYKKRGETNEAQRSL